MALRLCVFAEHKTDSLLSAVRGKSADTGLVKEYTRLAWQYYSTADTSLALSCLEKSLNLSGKLGFSRGELDSYSNLAMLYTAYGRIDSSLHYLSLCLAKARALRNGSVASKCCTNIASAYLNQANYEGAIRYYIEALKYFDAQKDRDKIAMTDHCIGIAYDLMKNYPLSLSYYRKAVDACMRLGKPESAGYSYNGMGVVYKELQQYDSALFYLDRSYQVAVTSNDRTLLSHTLSNLGEISSIRHDDAKAAGYLLKALDIQTALSDYRGRAESHILLGDVYLRKKDYARARSYFGVARFIAMQAGLSDILKNAWKGLSAAYQGLNDYPASLEAYRHYSDIKDSLYTSESTKQIADMQTRYDTEKKERENILLQRENEIRGLQLSKEKIQKYIIIISFVFILLMGAFYYNRYRLKQKNNLLRERELRSQAVFQAQENEKVKLSKDLHDGVGALLSLIKLNISGIEAEGEQEKILASTKDLASKAMKEVRNVSHNLMPSLLARAGLVAALSDMAAQVSAAGDVQVTLQNGLQAALKPEAELNIFRMVQEAINNIIKYASARKAVISLVQERDTLLVSIQDDGRGFDRHAVGSLPGNGLNNIFSRADMLKGHADVTSAPGQGTRVTIYLPLKHIQYA